jgi:hypothetical protein
MISGEGGGAINGAGLASCLPLHRNWKNQKID